MRYDYKSIQKVFFPYSLFFYPYMKALLNYQLRKQRIFFSKGICSISSQDYGKREKRVAENRTFLIANLAFLVF